MQPLIRLVTTASLVASVSASSCISREGKDNIGAEPDFVGFITLIRRGSDNASGQIMVESHAHKLVHRHAVTITNETVILRLELGIARRVTFDSLAEKDWVRIWIAGATQPLPTNVTARQLTVVERP